MFLKRLLMIVASFIFILTSCTPEHSKIVVAEFDDIPIHMGEFENAYSKNLGGPANVKNDSLEALKKFLDLYVNYKMKLRDAFVRGYTTDENMQKEIQDYKANIGSTLFLENTLYEPGMRQLFERRKYEVRASHIFIAPDSTRNTEQCIEFAKQLIDSLKMGKDFSELAKKYSKDTYTKDRGGDVYYFSAGQIASPVLENAVYNGQVGEVIPEPVNSGFGIHVIKVTEKLPRVPAIHARHILISLRDSVGKPLTDTIQAYQEIMDIKKKLDAGENFEELAKKYSEDKGSADRGGDLGFFSRGRMVREFDEAAFKLKPGEVSPVVRTQFGYHLIKLDEVQKPKTYEEDKEELRELYKKSHYKKEYADLIEKLKKEFNLVENEESINKIVDVLDSLNIGSKYWGSDLQKEIGGLNLFTANKKSFIADSLFSFLQQRKLVPRTKFNKPLFTSNLNQYEDETLVREKGMNYDKENPEFAKLMEDYENGVYLFKILDEEVWSKISVDSNLIAKYWEENKNNFRWNNRLEFHEIFCKKDSLANVVYNLAASGHDFDSLRSNYSQRSSFQEIPGYFGLVDENANPLAMHAKELNVGGISKPFQFQDGWSIVKLIKRDPARIKTLDEVKPEVASLVQEKESKRLEEEYISKLKSIYKPKYYYDELNQAFKN